MHTSGMSVIQNNAENYLEIGGFIHATSPKNTPTHPKSTQPYVNSTWTNQTLPSANHPIFSIVPWSTCSSPVHHRLHQPLVNNYRFFQSWLH